MTPRSVFSSAVVVASALLLCAGPSPSSAFLPPSCSPRSSFLVSERTASPVSTATSPRSFSRLSLSASASSSSVAIAPANSSEAVDSVLLSPESSSSFSATSSSSSSSSSSSASYYETLLSRFRGDFDNYGQVVRDRSRGFTEAREGGMHEHIHCTLIPVDVDLVRDYLGGGDSDSARTDGEEGEGEGDGGGDEQGATAAAEWRDARLAAFYFDASPERIFRLRLYVLRPDPRGAYLRLFTLGPALEGALRAKSEEPESWAETLERMLGKEGGECEVEDAVCFEELEGCDVLWTETPEPTRHAYAYGVKGSPPPHWEYLPDLDPRTAHHAVMVEGEATIPSAMMPGSMIRVVDELSLWDDYLWINDRGFCPETGAFIYGNHRGVPYEMRKIADWNDDGKGRTLVEEEGEGIGEELKWTLGRRWREEGVYEKRMGEIGGPTARMSRGGPPRRSPNGGEEAPNGDGTR